MSDEDLVQCPNNPNHQVPRSQIDEHVNTCKLLMVPNQETQITTSSDDEPRPSTSYQESLKEGSSLQKRSLLQEGSSQQEESQKAEFPNLQGRSFQEWRPPKDLRKLLEKSSSGLKMSRPNLRSFRKRGILAESEIESCKPKLKQDKKSSINKSEMRKESYHSILHEKIKLLEKLKIDSGSNEASSSNSGTTLSLKDTMPDKKKKFLYGIGTEYIEKLRSTSQQTGSSQQESSSQQLRTKWDELHKQMHVEKWVIQSSRFMSEVTTPFEVKLEEPPSTEDVLHEQSQSFRVPTETTNDSDRSQKSKMTEEKIHEKLDTKEKNKNQLSAILSEVITKVEVKLGELSLTADVPQQQLQSVSSPTETKHDSDRLQQSNETTEKKHEGMDTKAKMETEESHTLSQVNIQVGVESEKKETTDATVSHIFAEETKSRMVETEEPSLSRDASEIIVAQPGETSYDESPQEDISQQASSLLQNGRPQPEAWRRKETSDIWKFLHSVRIDSPEPIVTIYEDEDNLEPLIHRDPSTHETDASQGEDRLTIRSYRNLRESTDISNLQKERKSQEADVSSNADDSRRNTKFLQIKRCYHYSSTTDEDEGEKIDLEKPSSSSPKKRSKPVDSRGKTKHQLAAPQEASRQRKRSHKTSSESTDIGNLQKERKSQEADVSSNADDSRRNTKFLQIKRCYHYSSTTDEDEGEKIDLEKPSFSVPKEQSKPVVSSGKTKHQLDIPQEASKLRKRLYETSSESTDIDFSDLQKSGSSPKSAISPEADSSQRKQKFLEIRRRFETASTKDKDKDGKIDLEEPSTSSSKKQSKPVGSRGKTKHQLDVPQGASRQQKRSHETSSESTDIDLSDLQKSGSSPKSAISPEADSSQRKQKFLEIRRRFETASTKDKDKDGKIDLEEPSTSSSKKQSKPVFSPGKTKHQLDVPQEASKLRIRSCETSSEGTDIDIGDIPIASSSQKSAISPKGDGSQRKKKFLEIRKLYDSSLKKDEDKDKKKGI